MELHIEKEGRKWILWVNSTYIGRYSKPKLKKMIAELIE